MMNVESTANPVTPGIERIAARIRELGLEVPATIFLELHLPVASLLHTSVLFAQPMVTPLFGFERVQGLVELFSDRKNIEQLIERLTAKEC